MADGVRILENGDVRVTQSSDIRITENYVEIPATASLSGTGTLQVSTTSTTEGSAVLNGASSLSASAGYIFSTTAGLVATGTLDANADLYLLVPASASLSNGSSLVADAKSTTPNIILATFGKVTEDADRITEGSDLRLTEEGDTRVITLGKSNLGEGTLSARATIDVFVGENYINRSGNWALSIPYVKYGGDWDRPAAVYKNINGIWKRVY